jgi:hypothetical protein
VRLGSPNGDFDEALVGISDTGDIPDRLRLSLLSGLEPGAMSSMWEVEFQEVESKVEWLDSASRMDAGELYCPADLIIFLRLSLFWQCQVVLDLDAVHKCNDSQSR